MKDNPSRAREIADVFGAIRVRHAHRVARRD
jgi:hypothetical protein